MWDDKVAHISQCYELSVTSPGIWDIMTYSVGDLSISCKSGYVRSWHVFIHIF